MEEITKKLIDWYQKNKRDLPWRHTKNPYYIWVSEIMLQQTRVEAVKAYYERFIKKLPTLNDLASIKEDDLLKLWEGLGYYSRVKNMQKAAQMLINKGKSNLPNDKEKLLSLPGIGKYTAGAILSIAFLKPEVAIDGNVYRVIGRYYKIDKEITKSTTYSYFEEKMKNILPKKHIDDFTQSFMDLGNEICTPKSPKCKICPLQEGCQTNKTNTQVNYPIKRTKKKPKEENRLVFLFIYKKKIAIKKRQENGLLASMYEFPNYLIENSLENIENLLTIEKIPYQSVFEIGETKHVFSHKIWHLKGYLIEVEKPFGNFVWATKKELQEKYCIPSAFSYFSDFLLISLKENNENQEKIYL